jgi:hypothetical protein
MLRCFNPKYMLFWRVRNIAFQRALSTEQYQSALLALKSYAVSSRVLLQCRDSLQKLGSSSAFVGPELYFSLAPSSVEIAGVLT